MSRIKIAIAGVGNCASSLVQGIYYYRDKSPQDAIGLMHWEIGGYTPADIDVVAAFDIDKRKDINSAIFSDPNCTQVFSDPLPVSGVTVQMGRIMDGIADHMKEYEDRYTFLPADLPEPSTDEVVELLKESGAEILLNYMPVFIASDPEWARRFAEKNVPLIGDDIKSQLGATITHRILTDLFKKRGVKMERTYQLNTGGNTDFLNMLNRHRLKSKKKSKTEAVQSVTARRLKNENIHIGPSDYVPWQKDNKICFIRMEGKLFGDVPMNIELRLSVEDSPNSAGVAIDSLRCAKLALERGEGGVLEAPSAYFCKHPPRQFTDDEAYRMLEKFIKKFPGNVREMSDYRRKKGQKITVKEH